jgi:3-deoxy-D-manno-octulosonic-acid transferase
MPILFDLVFLLYSILYFPYLLITGRWHADFPQRFGFFSEDLKARFNHRGRNIWVHAVSVGEVVLAEGFINRLRDRWPGCVIVLSVTTKTGYELAQKRLSESAIVIAAPLDFSLSVLSFIRHINPKFYVAIETEIWPNLFGFLHAKQIPIAIINGRISDRSIGRYRMIKALLKSILSKVGVFAMQSQLDAERIKELGAPYTKVHTTGNLKFDDVKDGLAESLGFAPQPLWIAGSTHPGEEQIILDVFKKLSGWSLIIAPRHVERVEEVMHLITQAGFKAFKFSERKGAGSSDEVVVVDTIGQLRNLYASASLVFVGKSLCVGGGHNVIEPAVFAKPIVIGPMTENFRDIVACFKAEDAIIQANDILEFENTILNLSLNKDKREILGARARDVVNKNQGASARTLELIRPWV